MQLAKKKTKPVRGAMKKRIFTENTTNLATGEVVPKRWIDMQPVNGNNFIQMHIDTLAQLTGLTDAQWRLLSNLTKYVEYNTNQLYLSPVRKNEIAEITGLKYNTINQSVSRLVKKNLLLKISGSSYQMNPTLFFKGEEIEREKYLELTIRYTICSTCGEEPVNPRKKKLPTNLITKEEIDELYNDKDDDTKN